MVHMDRLPNRSGCSKKFSSFNYRLSPVKGLEIFLMCGCWIGHSVATELIKDHPIGSVTDRQETDDIASIE